MKQLKKVPAKQLEKFSNVFTQLGLVLVLFVVYITLEYETEEKKIAVVDFDATERVYVPDEQQIVFTKEPKIVKPKIELPKPQVFIVDVVQKGDNKVEETLFEESIKTPVITLDPNTLITSEEPVILDDDSEIPFYVLEDAPIFKGCEGLSKKENKECFAKMMNKFVQRNFDADLANELGLSSGKKRISTQFVIDKNGNIIDVQVRAPHPKLQKEAQRIIDMLPKFTPGKQRGNPVKVRYTLPILFQVQ